jgi:hypothetical protein
MSFIAAHPTAIPPAPSESYCPTASKEEENPESISSWQSVAYDSESALIERPGTPFIKRVSSIRLPDDLSHKTIDQLPSLLNLDLYGQDGTILNDVSDMMIMIIKLMDHKTYVN